MSDYLDYAQGSAGSGAQNPPDKNIGGVLLVMTCILLSFSTITTTLRIWARGMYRTLGLDDYTIIVCLLLAIGRSIIQFVSVSHGNGRHRQYLTVDQYQFVNFLGWLTQIFLFLDVGILKCSIALLILRIKDSKILNYGLYTMMAGLVITNLECVLVLLAECSPVEKYWSPKVPGKCWNVKVRIYSIYVQVGERNSTSEPSRHADRCLTAYSVTTDLICALLPILVLWNVQIKRSLKFAVCGLMSMGLIATASALVRASSLNLQTADLTYQYCVAAIWGNLELHLGIIATNLSLSRSIYGYFSGRTRVQTSVSQMSSLSVIRNRTRTRHDRSVDTGSNSSQIDLGPHVIKTTESQIEETRSLDRESDKMRGHISQQSWHSSPATEKGFTGIESTLSRYGAED